MGAKGQREEGTVEVEKCKTPHRASADAGALYTKKKNFFCKMNLSLGAFVTFLKITVFVTYFLRRT